MDTINIKTPISKSDIAKFNVGDKVLITGHIYMARDAAHKRMIETISKGEKLPFEIENQIIYYAGPCPAKPGEVIGSCGPTTSGRMDRYTPCLLDMGLLGMIGKGSRNNEVVSSINKNGAVYFGAIGGIGALLSEKIKSQQVIAYDDLGAEALRKLYVEDFPVTVLVK